MLKIQLTQDEHEKFFFGNSSSEIYFSLEELLKKSIASLMEECKKALIEENIVKTTNLIEKEVAAMESLYMAKCLRVLRDFEGVIRQIFSIPENAQIYPKSELETMETYTDEHVRTLRLDVKRLEEEIIREKMVIAKLRSEKETLKLLKPIYLFTKNRLEETRNQKHSDKLEFISKINEKLLECTKKIGLHGMNAGQLNADLKDL